MITGDVLKNTLLRFDSEVERKHFETLWNRIFELEPWIKEISYDYTEKVGLAFIQLAMIHDEKEERKTKEHIEEVRSTVKKLYKIYDNHKGDLK